MPKHANQTSFKVGQKVMSNGKPMGRPKGSIPWNKGIKQWENISHPMLGKNNPIASEYKKQYWSKIKEVTDYCQVSICKLCGNEFKHSRSKHRDYCSKSCSSLNQSPESRKIAASKSRDANIRNGSYKKISDRMRNGGAIHALRSKNLISYPQLILFKIITSCFTDTMLEYAVANKSLDIAIPSLKLDIEYDGEYWHQDKAKDAKRDKELISLGWKVIRYNKYGGRVV